jgi:simple sugar transport system permease protein
MVAPEVAPMSKFGIELPSELPSLRLLVAGVTVVLVVAFAGIGFVFPGTTAGRVADVTFRAGTLSSTLRLSVPIALAALGGIFSEKSGVINIGLEGLLIISAFSAVYAVDITDSLWVGFASGVFASTLLALLFAVVCIEFRADQIIAGLAVWLIALGLAPFLAQVVYNGPNSPSVKTVPTVTDVVEPVPVLSDLLAALAGIPFFGALFDADVTVYLMFLAVGAAWVTLYRTQFGRWVIASGENPKALDTAGVNVSRVRYAAIIISGVLSGLGGASLSLGLGQFTGNGPTMVNGKGFIAIVAYLFGNYNPIGAFFSTLLFAGLQAMQDGLQIINVGVPNQLIRIIPFVVVIIVLALVGRTRLPSAAGEHYESGED